MLFIYSQTRLKYRCNLIYNSFNRSVCERFDVGKATAWRSVWKVVKSIYNYLPLYIKWPTREEARITSNYVHRRFGFPNVLGAVDGTHVRIAQPKEHHASYINRKGFHSIQTQVLKKIYY